MAVKDKSIKPDEDEREFDLEDEDDLEEHDDNEDEDEDEGDEQEPTAEELKVELAKTKKALRKANREAARVRHNGKPAPVTPAGGDEGDDEKSGEVEQWKMRAIRSDTKAALMSAGFTGSPKAVARLTKLIDVDELDFEDDEILGLDEQIDELKEEFPNLFKDEEDEEPAVRRVRTESRVRGARDGKTTRKPLTASERQVQALLGGGRR